MNDYGNSVANAAVRVQIITTTTIQNVQRHFPTFGDITRKSDNIQKQIYIGPLCKANWFTTSNFFRQINSA